MGRTLTEWTGRVAELVRDTGYVDSTATAIEMVGVRPAITQFSTDRPRVTAVDIPAVGRYLPFPSAGQGWVEGFSTIRSIEAPAGQTPPAVLLDSDWQATRDPATPATPRILIGDDVAGKTCRIVFAAAWPYPTASAAVDLLGDAAFDAVTALAASLTLSSMAAEAARDRQGAMPSDFIDGNDRTRNMIDAAASWRTVYNTFVGLGSLAAPAASVRMVRTVAMGSTSKRLAPVDPLIYWPNR